jgi:hypothetical protein
MAILFFSQRIILISILPFVPLLSLLCVCLYYTYKREGFVVYIGTCRAVHRQTPRDVSDGRAGGARASTSPAVASRPQKGENHVTDIKGFTYTAAAQRIRLFYIIHRE